MSRMNLTAIREKMANEGFAKLFLSDFYPAHMDLIDELEFEDVTYPTQLKEYANFNCYNKQEQAIIQIKFDSYNNSIEVVPAISRLTRYYMPYVFTQDRFQN